MKSRFWKSFIVVVSVVLLIGFFKVGVLDNPELLFMVAEGFDEPSFPFYITLDRIYALAEKDNFSEQLIHHLSTGKNLNLHDIYIRVLGVIGEEAALHELFRAYQSYQSDPNHRATIYYIITSIGLIGNEGAGPFLETLLTKSQELRVQVDEVTILNALFLTTGRVGPGFEDSVNGRQKYKLSVEQLDARRIIVSSKGRKRSYDEMHTLDKIYRFKSEN